MAMIQCQECGERMSDEAIKCPQCGAHRLSAVGVSGFQKVCAVLGILMGAGVLFITSANGEHDNLTVFLGGLFIAAGSWVLVARLRKR